MLQNRRLWWYRLRDGNINSTSLESRSWLWKNYYIDNASRKEFTLAGVLGWDDFYFKSVLVYMHLVRFESYLFIQSSYEIIWCYKKDCCVKEEQQRPLDSRVSNRHLIQKKLTFEIRQPFMHRARSAYWLPQQPSFLPSSYAEAPIQMYSRVQKNWNEVFFKILEEPSIVQKKMIPHINGLGFSLIWSKKKFKMADLKNSKWPPQKNLIFQLRQFSIFFHEIFMDWSLG